MKAATIFIFIFLVTTKLVALVSMVDCVTNIFTYAGSVNASAFPTKFIIVKDGIIRSARNGAATDETATEFYVKTKPVISHTLNKK